MHRESLLNQSLHFIIENASRKQIHLSRLIQNTFHQLCHAVRYPGAIMVEK